MQFTITFEIDSVLLFYFKRMKFDEDGELVEYMRYDSNSLDALKEKGLISETRFQDGDCCYDITYIGEIIYNR